jgi:N6-L-threonylcarbamoyladenine synthase
VSRRYLGIDTSHYTTSLALYDAGADGMRQARRPLAVPAGQVGLRQNETVFRHMGALPELLDGLADGAAALPPVAAVGVSDRPRCVEGSYMPCFTAGLSAARMLARGLGVPVRTFSHQAGHVAAALWSAGRAALASEPFLAWHVSGGTTELLLARPDEARVFALEKVGGTEDLTAGQLVDRVGRRLGLPFPAGPALEALAGGTAWRGRVPTVSEGSFSLSGLQNRAERMIDEGAAPETVAAFVCHALARTLFEATARLLARRPGLPVLGAGGVMGNRIIREEMRPLGTIFPDIEYTSDNAAGPALLAAWTDGASRRAAGSV